MIVLNIDHVPGKEIEALGVVKGSTVQSKHLGKDIMSSFKTMVGGEIKSYTEMLDQARAQASKRMVEAAVDMGADAVINLRYTSSAVMQGAAEILAYGTAVKFK